MTALLFALLAPLAAAQCLRIDARPNILRSADALASTIRGQYSDSVSDSPGRLDEKKFYYSQSALLMTALLDYWHLTDDASANDEVTKALLAQRDDGNFVPDSLGTSRVANDDQCLWGMAAMLAAEDELPEPDEGSWFGVARSVYVEQKGRLNRTDECGGGLRWGIDSQHHGSEWKSTAANACLFDLSARLARYSQNETYADTAVELWDWMTDTGLIETDSWFVNAGVSATNCSGISSIQDSLPSLLLTEGAAFMYNYTNGTDKWRGRVEGLLAASLDDFFPEGIPFEPDCEIHSQCDDDTLSWRGANIRALASARQLVPFASASLSKALRSTAEAAASSCVQGRCGTYWYVLDEDEDESDGRGDLVRQVNALSAVANLLIEDAAPPAVRPDVAEAAEEEEERQEDDDSEEGGDTGADGEGGSGSDSGSPGSDDDNDDDGQGAGRALSGSFSVTLLLAGLMLSVLGAGR